MTDDKREIGYLNNTTGEVIWGYNQTYHAFSASGDELDDTGHYEFMETVNGNPTRLKADIKSRRKLDNQRRSGKHLWSRVYDRKVLENAMERKGVRLSADSNVQTLEQKYSSQNSDLSEMKSDVSKEVEAKPEKKATKSKPKKLKSEDESDLAFTPVVSDEGDDAFEAGTT